MNMTIYTRTTAGTHAAGVELGIQQMPPGYRLDQLDSGHYMWVCPIPGTGHFGQPDDHDQEGAINCDRWAVWRDAQAHYLDAWRTSHGLGPYGPPNGDGPDT